MSIKLIALDLDGTLLNSNGQISTENRQAITDARARDIRIALVTGRRFRDARPLALELGLDVPLISHNGALTKHARSLETVNATLLPVETARHVVRLGHATGADAMVSDGHEGFGQLIYERISPGNSALEDYIRWSRRVRQDDATESKNGNAAKADDSVRQVASLEAYLSEPPVHVAFSGTCAQMTDLAEHLTEELGAQQVRVLRTLYIKRDFALLDVLSPAASKGLGLAAVAAEYNLERAEVMACGDNFNDVEMLEFAGTGVVMGNADSELRARSDFIVTATNDEHGVAQAINRFALDEESADAKRAVELLT